MRFINLGRTSPSAPAASSSAASHKDSTVPTSCAKHSVHVRSAFGRPSVQGSDMKRQIQRGTNVCFDHLASGNTPLDITYSHGY